MERNLPFLDFFSLSAAGGLSVSLVSESLAASAALLKFLEAACA